MNEQKNQYFLYSFPLELHAVHWNKKYGNMSEATKYSDGLAVLGYLIRVNEINI